MLIRCKYASGLRPEQSLRKVIIFGDSLPRGIRIHEFNSLVKKGYAKMKSFPGATLKELLHYVDRTLKMEYIIRQSYMLG